MNTPEQHRQHQTLVTCGTGKTGSRVVERFTARAVPVRVGSRSGEPPFDWGDRTTWTPTLADVDGVYLTYLPDIGAPQATDDITAFCDLAVTAGVRRMVLLSGRNEPQAQRCERVVQRYPWEWTVVRSSVFSQDFSEAFWLEPVRSGVVAFPAGDVAEPFVDADDVADVVTAALTEDGHAGQVYEVSGPRALTLGDAVAEIEQVTGRTVRYQPISQQQYVAALVDAGLPAQEAGFVGELLTALFDGRNTPTTDGVQRALGRPPNDFSRYAAAAARSGVWTE